MAAQATTNPVHNLSWASAGAIVVAMASLYHGISMQGSEWIPALGLIILASMVFTPRLPAWPLLTWLIRGGLFAAIIFTSGSRSSRTLAWMFDSDYVNLFGYLCAAELAIQVWQGRPTPPRGEVLILSCLVFAASTNVGPRDSLIPYLSPLFVTLLAISLRGHRKRLEPREWILPRLAWIGLAVAMGIGLLIAEGLRVYGDRVSMWPLKFLLGQAPMHSVGLSTTPHLGRSFNVGQSPERVLIAQDLRGESHLRAMTFDTYDSGGWLPRAIDRRFALASHAQLRSDSAGPRARITRLVSAEPAPVFAPLNSAGIVAGPSPLSMDQDRQGLLRTPTAEPNVTYEVILALRPDHQGPLTVAMTPAQRQACLAVSPQIDPKVRELGASFAAAGTVAQRVRAVVDFLGNNNTYSLDVEPAAGDPVNDFILNRRSAHCQFFASAAVTLLRSAGVPARFVTGFYAHETTGRTTTVRQQDAHAWAEAWIDGVGWVTVEATPASGRPDKAVPPASWWRRMRERVGDWASLAWGWIKSNWMALAGGAVGLFLAVRGLKLLFARVRGRRRIGDDTRYARPTEDLAAIAAQFERLLRRLGGRCGPCRTWREHIDQFAVTQPAPVLDNLRQFITAYNAARFGQASGDDLGARLRSLEHRETGSA